MNTGTFCTLHLYFFFLLLTVFYARIQFVVHILKGIQQYKSWNLCPLRLVQKYNMFKLNQMPSSSRSAMPKMAEI